MLVRAGVCVCVLVLRENGSLGLAKIYDRRLNEWRPWMSWFKGSPPRPGRGRLFGARTGTGSRSGNGSRVKSRSSQVKSGHTGHEPEATILAMADDGTGMCRALNLVSSRLGSFKAEYSVCRICPMPNVQCPVDQGWG